MTPYEGPTARLRVHNSGVWPLALWLEPYGSDHWLRPGEVFVVHTWGYPDPYEPFEVEYREDAVTVNVGGHGYVADLSGTEIECGHGRPAEGSWA
ncbi:hypothetical protein ACGFZL_01845 [Streptomyces sp. NPDC048182]|uniref:hypothetical protein n=1 Tax=unclassified Streptomyces TaxID=2593676 RepID=UPI0033BB57A8